MNCEFPSKDGVSRHEVLIPGDSSSWAVVLGHPLKAYMNPNIVFFPAYFLVPKDSKLKGCDSLSQEISISRCIIF